MMQIIGNGWLADELQELESLLGVDQAVAFSGLDMGTLTRAGNLLSTDTPTLWAFTARNALGLLRTRLARSAPCPRCVLYHLATLRNEDIEDFAKLSSSQRVDAIETLRTNAPSVSNIEQTPFVRLVDTESGNVVESSVIYRHLGCDHTFFPDVPRPQDSTGLEDARMMYAFFDPYFGPIRTIKRSSKTAPSAALPGDVVSVFSWFVNQLFIRHPRRYPVDKPTIGTDFSGRGAAVRSIMEALERRALFAPPTEGVRATESEIPALRPTSFYLYRDEQYERNDFPFERYDPDTEYLWVRCQPITSEFEESSDERYVPADFVRVETSSDVPPIVDATSNGFAAHTNQLKAIRNGLLELFERDALLTLWHDNRSPKRISVDSIPDSLQSRVRSLQEEYDVHIIDATRYDPFRTFAVICTASRKMVRPRVVVTGGCATDPARALRKALRECFGRIQTTLVRDGSREVPSKENVETPSDHIAFYEAERHSNHLKRLIYDGERVHFTDVTNRRTSLTLESIISTIEQYNIDAYWRDVTQDALASNGVNIVRVLSPDLVPITFGYGMDRLNHPESPLSASENLDVPHPFP